MGLFQETYDVIVVGAAEGAFLGDVVGVLLGRGDGIKSGFLQGSFDKLLPGIEVKASAVITTIAVVFQEIC